MATEVYETLNVTLQDGQEITIRPLNIKNLRGVMKAWEQVNEVKDEMGFIDVLVDCTAVAMKQFYPEIAHDKDAIEEAVDMATITKILKIAADIDLEALQDPNLQAAAKELVGQS